LGAGLFTAIFGTASLRSERPDGTGYAPDKFAMKKDVTFGKRILLIEDDPAARESTKLLLNIDRHTVTEAEDGIAGLALFTRQPFDLVVLDYFMPGLDGGEVARRIKGMAPSMPILMITAYLEKLVGFDKPVNAVLAKPFAVDELRGEITKLLSAQH
jgi:two-component system response regulator MprA